MATSSPQDPSITTSTSSTISSSTTSSTTAASSTTVISTSTSSSTTTTTSSTTTTTALNLRTCSPDAITYVEGDDSPVQENITVTYMNYSYTQIGDTEETTSTMMITCSAIAGYDAYMVFNGGGVPSENQGFPMTVTITAICNSVDMIWNYVVVINGVTYTRVITSVRCQQAPTVG